MKPCHVYIKKYNSEICDKLRMIGISYCGYTVNFADTIVVSTAKTFYIYSRMKSWRLFKMCEHNACENEELFIAIAALLRDDDKFQYFIVDEDFEIGGTPISKGFVYMCLEEHNSIRHSHKMNVSELKSHFLNGGNTTTITRE